MARSKTRRQRRAAAAPSLNQLRTQTAEAIARGSFQRARELAKTLCKQDASAAHRRYLIEATLGRAAQLRRAGQLAEAVGVLHTVIEGEFDSPELLMQCINELMLAGDWQVAATLTRQVTDPDMLHQLQMLRADVAMLHTDFSMVDLPAEVRSVAPRVLRALTDLAQGDDAAAHEAVAAIPNDSPLHDWKLLIQGLTAFYAGAPAALEFWQQLRPEGAPAAIATPFRAQIDPAFLASQPQPAQLVAFGRELHDAPWLTALEDVARLLAQDNLSAALSRAAVALEAMPTEYQELRERLARAMYWQVARLGDDDDIGVYARRFGAPRDDPSLYRLHALDHEYSGDKAEAQDAWALYEQDLAKRDIVSKKDRQLARALVWFHMGELAGQDVPTRPAGFSLRLRFNAHDTCAVTAANCFRRSAKLAPLHLQAHESLLDLLHQPGKQRQVVTAARNLLQHFPEHERALEVLAGDAFRRSRWHEAVTWQQRAVQVRPHDTGLAARLQFYELGLARLLAQEEKFDEARAILEAHLQKERASDHCNILCRQAAVELKAGAQQRAEELFKRASEVATSRLVAVFEMLIESIRMPVEATWIRKMNQEFRRGLRAPVDGPSAVTMLKTLSAFASREVSYDGLQEHQKLILQYLGRARKVAFSQEEVESICASLQTLPAHKLLLDFATRGSKEFPQQPIFPFAVATYYLSLAPARCPWSKVHDMLHSALDLAQANPAYTTLVRQIEAALSVVHSRSFGNPFGGYVNPFDDDDDDDDDPLSPDLFDAMADLFGFSFGDDDELDDAPWGRPRRGGSRRQGRNRRKRLL